MVPIRYFFGRDVFWRAYGDDLIIHLNPDGIIPEPSVVYDGVYEAAKNNGREYCCTGYEASITDPVGDSAGFGLDGNDLTGVDVCSAGNVLLVTVAYSSLSPDDGVVTTVAFDTVLIQSRRMDGSIPSIRCIRFKLEGN